MHKKLRFNKNLVPLVLSGEKYKTWRFWDDKNLQVGDILDFLERPRDSHFATAKVIEVLVKKMSELTKEDKKGHEKFKDDLEMYETYSGYYNREVTSQTEVKIIRFELI